MMLNLDSMRTYVLPVLTSFTLTYSNSALTHNAKFDGSVHGVVVQARSETDGSESSGNDTTTEY